MANFVVIVDPNPERRSHYIKAIEPLIPPVKGLITNSCSIEHFQALWAANPKAPISYVAEPSGAAVIWGDAIAPDSSARIEASTLRHLWKLSDHQSYFDGFYAAVVYDSQGSLCVGADLLGLFPIYYYTVRDVALIGSSPELFRYHPLFKATFNPAGLVGNLLTNGIINGQTLWQDVKRLGAGNLLVWEPDTLPKEVKQYQIGTNSNLEKYAKLPFEQQLDLLEQAIERACDRQIPKNHPYSLLLSGGLDSRMLAGFIYRQGINPVAITLGIATDLDMQCAISVARTLQLKHDFINLSFEQYPVDADLLVKWEHLTNGFNCLMDWGIQSYLSKGKSSNAIAGYLMDRVIGGKWTYSLSAKNLSFETFFPQINAWGFSPELLAKLLRKDVFGDLVQDTLAQIQTTYHHYSENESIKAWCFELYHRQRFHVGCAAWQLCFGAWPILPILDRQLIETATAFPLETIAKRRAQEQLLCTRFPHLAALPIARNNFNVEPLQPTKIRQQLAPLFGVQRKWRRWRNQQGYEQRYYYRTYDINNAGWLAVRKQAEPYRDRVEHLLHPEVLNQIVPPPEVPVQCKLDPIAESSGIKALLGFLLWSKNYL